MYILGISAFYHDSAAALIKDAQVICAAEEERFTRIKHDNQFPLKSIQFCLDKAGISVDDIAYVAYYEKPLLKFERILENFIKTYPLSLTPFLESIPDWLGKKIKVEQDIKKRIGFKGKIFFVPHHLSHAAASFYPSPFDESAILTVDGIGEYQTTGLWHGKENKITPLKQLDFPNSLGLLYSTCTAFLGFRVNEDEYKVMGLSAYGTPSNIKAMHQLVDIKEDGSFKMNMKFFSFRQSFKMWNQNFEKLFGKPRREDEAIVKKHEDFAASIQKVTEEIYFKILNHLHSLTRSKNVCIGGGVALNALANGKIYSETQFKNAYILGAAGDSGTALGCALFVYHSILGNKKRYPVKNLNLGSSYSDNEIESTLKRSGTNYKKMTEEELIEKTASLLEKNKIIGWFQDQMEFGPRSLGSRSILANPKPAFIKAAVNKIKKREQFRPFAGSILQEKVHDYFKVPEKNHFSPFMTFCFEVKEKKKKDLESIVHKDQSCRIQTVNKNNGIYYKLISKFYEKTGVPCILNTSFNVNHEPIVETPKQAVEDFLKTTMDYLIIGNFLVSKEGRRV